MIADTAILSTSPWQGGQADQVLAKDAPFPSPLFDSPIFDMDYISLGVEIERLKAENERIATSATKVSMSAGTSVASSDCSDEAFVEFDGDSDSLFAMSEDQDYLSSSFYNMLDVNAVTESFQFEWNADDLDVNADSLLTSPVEEVSSQQDEVPSTRNSPQTSRKRSHSQTLTDHKPWSKMTHSEQTTTIQELSSVISYKMGLREQLEVIRIMNPEANVLHTDKEFVIDLDSLSDEKLARVREFVRQHISRSETQSSPSNSPSSSSPTTALSSSYKNRNSAHTHSTQHTKHLTKKQRRSQEKEERQRQRKEYRQMMKEKKSGLFKKEQVLSLACDDKSDSEDDVDILT